MGEAEEAGPLLNGFFIGCSILRRVSATRMGFEASYPILVPNPQTFSGWSTKLIAMKVLYHSTYHLKL